MVSKKLFSAVVVTALILSVLGGSSVAFAQQTTTVTRTTITQTAASDPDFSTLVGLLQNTTNFSGNLTAAQALNATDKNYTVLAPTNEAFAKLNASTLAEVASNATLRKAVLSYHVIPRTVNFSTNATYTTVGGQQLDVVVNGTTVKVGTGNNTATFSTTNVTNTANGNVVTIDKVLLPPAGAVKSAAASAAASATASGGIGGLPGFEAVYAVAGLLAVAYLVIRRRK